MSRAVKLVIESAHDVRTIVIAQGHHRRLTEILRREHLPLNTRCGQRGLCDGCVVELLAGQLIHLAAGKPVAIGSIRGCEVRLGEGSEVRIRIPPRSLLAYEPQIVSEFRTRVPRAHDPIWQIIEVPADGSLHDAIARQTKRRRSIRLAPAVSGLGFQPMSSDGAIHGQDARATGGKLFATMEYRDDHWFVSKTSRTAPGRVLGAAIDIGTTTVATLVVDLANGEIVGRAADFNKQMHLGDDVATRIGLCQNDPTMLQQLQKAVIAQTIAPLLAEGLREANATPDQLVGLAVAGNTTMLHLFAGVDPTPMGIFPFTPGFLNHRVITADTIGLWRASLPASQDTSGLAGASPSIAATIHLFPSAAAYIGADITAGIFASGLAYDDGPSLLVDVGTNGEIILKTGGHLFGCATAAGPAFEGAGLTNGIRATTGAIESVRLTGEPLRVETKVIGDVPPVGICGSAYVDFLAEGRRTGLLSATGRFTHGKLSLARDIVISETDIAHLLQSKAAIAAGILTLLERVHLTPSQIKKVYLAGGFGLHLNVANAIGCGLLPGFTETQIEVVGNTSLAGAYLGLLDCGALDEITRISKRIEIVELNLDPNFESRYIDQLSLP